MAAPAAQRKVEVDAPGAPMARAVSPKTVQHKVGPPGLDIPDGWECESSCLVALTSQLPVISALFSQFHWCFSPAHFGFHCFWSFLSFSRMTALFLQAERSARVATTTSTSRTRGRSIGMDHPGTTA